MSAMSHKPLSNNVVIVVLGASGDLAKKKTVCPTLHTPKRKKKLSTNTHPSIQPSWLSIEMASCPKTPALLGTLAPKCPKRNSKIASRRFSN